MIPAAPAPQSRLNCSCASAANGLGRPAIHSNGSLSQQMVVKSDHSFLQSFNVQDITDARIFTCKTQASGTLAFCKLLTFCQEDILKGKAEVRCQSGSDGFRPDRAEGVQACSRLAEVREPGGARSDPRGEIPQLKTYRAAGCQPPKEGLSLSSNLVSQCSACHALQNTQLEECAGSAEFVTGMQ